LCRADILEALTRESIKYLLNAVPSWDVEHLVLGISRALRRRFGCNSRCGSSPETAADPPASKKPSPIAVRN
jgi:hypothetical protein